MHGGQRGCDVAVVGAGFGGLGAALRLAELGARVTVFERLTYPGGCASTFRRDGYAFESGATLSSGFAPGQLFAGWIDRHAIPVTIDWIDPLVELRAPDVRLVVRRDRDALLRQFLAMPGANAAALHAFFAEQRQVADALWAALDDPSSLPPVDLAGVWRHLTRLPRYLPVARVIGRTLGDVLRRHGLDGFAPLRRYCDALCQITVQCSAGEAEAPFALGCMDYYYRGTAHVRGGIGELAWGLTRAIERAGGTVRFADRVRALRRDGDGWSLDTRGGSLRADHVVANLLPADLATLLGPDASGAAGRLANPPADGWGACMLYLAIAPPDDAGSDAHHLQLIQDPTAPLVEGNHLFCSVSGARDPDRAPAGERTVTISTHVPLRRLAELPSSLHGEFIGGVQARMHAGVRALVPEWAGRVRHALTASPRTFARFTGRTDGWVGGVPRRVGLRHYLHAWNAPVAPGLHLVGDSVFPGQSTLAAALGGVQVAERIAGRGTVALPAFATPQQAATA